MEFASYSSTIMRKLERLSQLDAKTHGFQNSYPLVILLLSSCYPLVILLLSSCYPLVSQLFSPYSPFFLPIIRLLHPNVFNKKQHSKLHPIDLNYELLVDYFVASGKHRCNISSTESSSNEADDTRRSYTSVRIISYAKEAVYH